MSNHHCQFRVYYEDTDAGGVVYYANYLKFFERARTELLRSLDLEQSDLAKQHDVLFVVRKANLDLQAPAILDDLLTISTKVVASKGATLVMHQHATNQHDKLLASLEVTIVCINQAFKPKRVPELIAAKMLSS